MYPQGALPLRCADVQGEGLCQEGGDDQAQQVAPEDGRGTQVRLQVGTHHINHQISMIIIHLFQIIPLKDLRGLTKVYTLCRRVTPMDDCGDQFTGTKRVFL